MIYLSGFSFVYIYLGKFGINEVNFIGLKELFSGFKLLYVYTHLNIFFYNLLFVTVLTVFLLMFSWTLMLVFYVSDVLRVGGCVILAIQYV